MPQALLQIRYSRYKEGFNGVQEPETVIPIFNSLLAILLPSCQQNLFQVRSIVCWQWRQRGPSSSSSLQWKPWGCMSAKKIISFLFLMNSQVFFFFDNLKKILNMYFQTRSFSCVPFCNPASFWVIAVTLSTSSPGELPVPLPDMFSNVCYSLICLKKKGKDIRSQWRQ